MNKYAHEYVDSRREKLLKEYPTEDKFVENYYLSLEDIEEFKKFITDEGVEISDEDWKVSGDDMLIRLRAFIGRNLFEPSTFYRIIGDLNETLQTALEVIIKRINAQAANVFMIEDKKQIFQ